MMGAFMEAEGGCLAAISLQLENESLIVSEARQEGASSSDSLSPPPTPYSTGVTGMCSHSWPFT